MNPFQTLPIRGILFAFWCAATLTRCLGSPPQYFESGGQTLAYRVQGEGPPLILVHGFMGTGPVHWELPGTAARLAAQFQEVLEAFFVAASGSGANGQ